MTRLFLIRHGETAWNKQHRFQGSADIPLNGVGLAQAEAVGERMASLALSRIVSSDLKRAYQTAAAVVHHHPTLTIEADTRLREISFGKWEGLTYKQIQETYPDDLLAWQSDIMTPSTEGEPVEDFYRRIATFADQFEPFQKDELVAVCAHGGALQMLLCHLLDLPPSSYWKFRMYNTAVSEVRIHEAGAMLVSFNDTYHLK